MPDGVRHRIGRMMQGWGLGGVSDTNIGRGREGLDAHRDGVARSVRGLRLAARLVVLIDRLFRPTPMTGRGLAVRLGLFIAWLVAVTLLATRHVMWRDEVRALSLAAQGHEWIDMIRSAQGYGHPLLWHVLLRASLTILPYQSVLPVVAGMVAALAMAWLCLRSRLHWPIIALVLFGWFGLYEYSVMARNYGLSALLLFLFAELYRSGRGETRRHAMALGLILALLCNANIHSVLLAGGLLLFWLIELLWRDGWRWSGGLSLWVIAAACAVLGALLAILSIYPSAEDVPGAAQMTRAMTLLQLVPGVAMSRIFALYQQPWYVVLAAALLTTGSLALFARRPSALIAAAAVFLSMQLLFVFVYPGSYRHTILFILFLLTLHIITTGAPRTAGVGARRIERVGQVAFLMLLVGQWPATILSIRQILSGQTEGSGQALATVLHDQGVSHPIVMAEPDYLIETLPYYGLQTWSTRLGYLAPVVPLRLKDSAPVTLGVLLSTGQRLARDMHRPVVILMAPKLDPDAPDRIIDRPRLGSLVLRQSETRAFLSGTQQIASLRAGWNDENYNVYLIDAPPRQPPQIDATDR